MKTRKEVAKFINDGVPEGEVREKDTCWHYGMQEIRELMDFIYEGKPESDDENITNLDTFRMNEGLGDRRKCRCIERLTQRRSGVQWQEPCIQLLGKPELIS